MNAFSPRRAGGILAASGRGNRRDGEKNSPTVGKRGWESVRTSVVAAVVTIAAILGGCSASEIVQNWTPGPVPDLSEPNYRRIIADNIKTVFPNKNELGTLEISGVRQVAHLKGPAWLTCLKLDAHGHPQHYAIFIQGNKIIDTRVGILLDQCHKEAYTPFEISLPPKKET
jgi:hypothetical protein